MKKILFVLAVMLTMTLTVNAQFYAGGSFQLHADKANYEFAVSPEIGYTFQSNTAVGCVFDFSYDKGLQRTLGFGVNPYFEYGFLTIGDKFIFYVHTYLHYNFVSADFLTSESKFDHNYGISLNPGVSWGVTDHWSASFDVGGVKYMWNQPAGKAFKDGTGDFNLGFETNIPFAVALYYNF